MSEELRCTCASNHLLGVVGSEGGRIFLHVKSQRSKRLLTELFIEAGSRLRIRCPSCSRFTLVMVKSHQLQTIPDFVPEQISVKC